MTRVRQSAYNPFALAYYLFILAVHLLAIVIESDLIRSSSKSQLMPALLLYYVVNAPKQSNRWLVYLAIVASWLGDLFLMQQGSGYFMAGLASFLLAHVFYIVIFRQLIDRDKPVRRKTGWIIGIVIYVILLIYWLFQHMDNGLKIPVLVYALTIAGMLLLAIQVDTERRSSLLVPGAILFVVSDSLLAINKFVQPFPLAGVAIMVSYGLAQLFIIHSIARIS
ncbi:MAG TPA: lysoplasmalogenase [Flavihumibacter sp.]|jgi:uncharacterized membrane protein YhhN